MAMLRSRGARSLATRAIDHEVAVGDFLKARDHPQRRRLAAARRADQHEKLAILDRQVERVHGKLAVVIALGDAVEDDFRHGIPCPRSDRAKVPCPPTAMSKTRLAEFFTSMRLIVAGLIDCMRSARAQIRTFVRRRPARRRRPREVAGDVAAAAKPRRTASWRRHGWPRPAGSMDFACAGRREDRRCVLEPNTGPRHDRNSLARVADKLGDARQRIRFERCPVRRRSGCARSRARPRSRAPRTGRARASNARCSVVPRPSAWLTRRNSASTSSRPRGSQAPRTTPASPAARAASMSRRIWSRSAGRKDEVALARPDHGIDGDGRLGGEPHEARGGRQPAERQRAAELDPVGAAGDRGGQAVGACRRRSRR